MSVSQYSIFGHYNDDSGIQNMSDCFSAACRHCYFPSLLPLFWFLVQAGSTVCPEREAATVPESRRTSFASNCSYTQCQAFIPNAQPHSECDARWKCTVENLRKAEKHLYQRKTNNTLSIAVFLVIVLLSQFARRQRKWVHVLLFRELRTCFLNLNQDLAEFNQLYCFLFICDCCIITDTLERGVPQGSSWRAEVIPRTICVWRTPFLKKVFIKGSVED